MSVDVREIHEATSASARKINNIPTKLINKQLMVVLFLENAISNLLQSWKADGVMAFEPWE